MNEKGGENIGHQELAKEFGKKDLEGLKELLKIFEGLKDGDSLEGIFEKIDENKTKLSHKKGELLKKGKEKQKVGKILSFLKDFIDNISKKDTSKSSTQTIPKGVESLEKKNPELVTSNLDSTKKQKNPQTNIREDNLIDALYDMNYQENDKGETTGVDLQSLEISDISSYDRTQVIALFETLKNGKFDVTSTEIKETYKNFKELNEGFGIGYINKKLWSDMDVLKAYFNLRNEEGLDPIEWEKIVEYNLSYADNLHQISDLINLSPNVPGQGAEVLFLSMLDQKKGELSQKFDFEKEILPFVIKNIKAESLKKVFKFDNLEEFIKREQKESQEITKEVFESVLEKSEKLSDYQKAVAIKTIYYYTNKIADQNMYDLIGEKNLEKILKIGHISNFPALQRYIEDIGNEEGKVNFFEIVLEKHPELLIYIKQPKIEHFRKMFINDKNGKTDIQVYSRTLKRSLAFIDFSNLDEMKEFIELIQNSKLSSKDKVQISSHPLLLNITKKLLQNKDITNPETKKYMEKYLDKNQKIREKIRSNTRKFQEAGKKFKNSLEKNDSGNIDAISSKNKEKVNKFEGVTTNFVKEISKFGEINPENIAKIKTIVSSYIESNDLVYDGPKFLKDISELITFNNVKESDESVIDTILQNYIQQVESIKTKALKEKAYKPVILDTKKDKIEKKFLKENGELDIEAVFKDYQKKKTGIEEKLLKNKKDFDQNTLVENYINGENFEGLSKEKKAEALKRLKDLIASKKTEIGSTEQGAQAIVDAYRGRISEENYDEIINQVVYNNKTYEEAQTIANKKFPPEISNTKTNTPETSSSPSTQTFEVSGSTYTEHLSSDTPYLESHNGDGNIYITKEEAKIIQDNPKAKENLINFYNVFQELNLESIWTYREKIALAIGNVNINLKDDSLKKSEIILFGTKLIKAINNLHNNEESELKGPKLDENTTTLSAMMAEFRKFSEANSMISSGKTHNNLGEDKFATTLRNMGIIGGTYFKIHTLREATKT